MSEEWRPPRALLVLMRSLIDYAGLFPPAGLGMVDAIRRFGGYRAGPESWALGRFVVPVARLSEAESEVLQLPRASIGDGCWPLTVLASDRAADDVPRILEFNEAHGEPGASWPARIESVEVKVSSAAEIERLAAAMPAAIEVFFEVPMDAAIGDLARAASAVRRAVKIRTGGTTIDAFPPSAVVARVLGECAAAHAPFKATAGLHHPVRAAHPVTYEAGAPSATMHGFLNVFVAASFLFAGKSDVSMATRVLEDELPASFRFDEDGLRWRECRLAGDEIVAARDFARGFGSCSFEEPMSDLAALVTNPKTMP